MINTAQTSTFSQAESLIQDFESQTQMNAVKDFARRTLNLEEHECSLIFMNDDNHVYLMQDGSLVLEGIRECSVHAITTAEFKDMARTERMAPKGSIPDIINNKAIDEAFERATSMSDASKVPLLCKANTFNMTQALLENPVEVIAQAA